MTAVIFGTDMKKYIALLTFLISSLTITGISFIDGKIWDVVFLVIGMIAYAIVGVLFSIGVLHGKQAGIDAYAFVTVLLLLGGYAAYEGLLTFKKWVISWPLFVKIIVPIIIVLLIIGLIVLVVFKRKKEAKKFLVRQNNYE